jgi:hypothetical protein
MEKIDLQKICDECGLIYHKDSSNIETGYYNGKVIFQYVPGQFVSTYKNNIICLSSVAMSKYGLNFVYPKQIYNDDYNYNFLKKSITEAIIKYKELIQADKEQKIKQDFE